MDSRLLDTLNAQASAARDPVVWAKAVCRAASHFARHGKTENALKAISVVRAHYGKNLEFEIASWLMLAEGTLHYYQSQFPQAYDRMRRAYGLAIALGTESALPSCAAWMAQFEFNDCKYDDMIVHLDEALKNAKPDDHQAIARLSLVISEAYHLTGDYTLARPWYDQARISTAAEGDNASVSARLYNAAAFRASNVRLDDMQGKDVAAEAHRTGLETSSSYTYDCAIGTEDPGFLTPILRGLSLTLEKKFQEAVDVYASIDESKVIKRLLPLKHVDQAWCLRNLGDRDRYSDYVRMAESNVELLTEDDDLAYIFGRLSQVYELDNASLRASALRERSNHHLERHHDFQRSLHAKLRSIDRPVNKKSPT